MIHGDGAASENGLKMLVVIAITQRRAQERPNPRESMTVSKTKPLTARRFTRPLLQRAVREIR